MLVFVLFLIKTEGNDEDFNRERIERHSGKEEENRFGLFDYSTSKYYKMKWLN